MISRKHEGGTPQSRRLQGSLARAGKLPLGPADVSFASLIAARSSLSLKREKAPDDQPSALSSLCRVVCWLRRLPLRHNCSPSHGLIAPASRRPHSSARCYDKAGSFVGSPRPPMTTRRPRTKCAIDAAFTILRRTPRSNLSPDGPGRQYCGAGRETRGGNLHQSAGVVRAFLPLQAMWSPEAARSPSFGKPLREVAIDPGAGAADAL